MSQAQISYVRGEEIIESECKGLGSVVNSHQLVLITHDEHPTLVESQDFVVGDSINTTIRFNESDQIIGRVLVETQTKVLPQPNDIGLDNRGKEFLISDVIPLPETRRQQILWIEDTKHFNPGDVVSVRTGYDYALVDTHEDVVIENIYRDGRNKGKKR